MKTTLKTIIAAAAIAAVAAPAIAGGWLPAAYEAFDKKAEACLAKNGIDDFVVIESRIIGLKGATADQKAQVKACKMEAVKAAGQAQLAALKEKAAVK